MNNPIKYVKDGKYHCITCGDLSIFIQAKTKSDAKAQFIIATQILINKAIDEVKNNNDG